MDQVRSVNDSAFWLTTGAGERIPRVIEERLAAGSGSGSSVRSGSTETSKEREANERLAVFLGLIFAHPGLNIDGKTTSISPAVWVSDEGCGGGSYDGGEHVLVCGGCV